MRSLRNRVLQLTTGMRPRLLSESVDKSDTPTEDDSKDKKKKKPENVCGRPERPTGPRCKNKPAEGQHKDKEAPKTEN